MNLGETIYNLRKEKKLSQGDLAEQLSVSRQSVSKWENNSAVPDLDKLVKLSTIFGVSLDELVKGEMQAGEADNGGQAAEAEHTDTAKSIITKRFIVGMVLMGVGAIVGIMSMFLLGSIMALIFSLPFIICGAECIIFKKNAGLWCMWTLYFCLNLYVRMAAGVSRGLVIASIIYWAEFGSSLNPVQLVVALVLLISLAVLIIVTVARLSRNRFAGKKELVRVLAVSWAIYVIIRIFGYVFPRTDAFIRLFSEELQNGVTILKDSVGYYYVLVETVQTAAFTVAMVNTVRALRNVLSRRAKRGTQEENSINRKI